MTDFYSQNRCVCSTRSHGPLLCAFCLSFHFNRSMQSHDIDMLGLLERWLAHQMKHHTNENKRLRYFEYYYSKVFVANIEAFHISLPYL